MPFCSFYLKKSSKMVSAVVRGTISSVLDEELQLETTRLNKLRETGKSVFAA